MQPLTEWQGDVESLLTEMKRRGGFSTDTELAKSLGTSQSNVSTWRKRGRVPTTALLRFERLSFDGASAGHRLLAARMVAIRVAEHAFARAVERGSGAASRVVFYMTIAAAWEAIVKAVVADLQKKEAATKRWPSDLAGQLIDDRRYLDGLADWVMSMPAVEALSAPAPALPQSD